MTAMNPEAQLKDRQVKTKFTLKKRNRQTDETGQTIPKTGSVKQEEEQEDRQVKS